MAKQIGYWKLEWNEGWEEYLQAIGLNMLLRKVATSITSYLEISQDGDEWTLSILSTFRNKTTKFKLGVEYDEVSMDGRDVRACIYMDGDKLVHIQKGKKEGDFDATVTRERVDDDTLVESFHILNTETKARRIYKKVQKS